MKIQMDTVAKTIKMEENVKLDKLINTLKKLLPNNEWKQFTLETNTVIHNWSSPVIIKEYPIYPRPTYTKWDWYCNSNTGDLNKQYVSELKAGTFNIEA